MGKYMRKAKITGEVAVMDVSHQPPLGVRTRARALALQRLQVTPAPPDNPDDPGCYLQLRSRRLEKTRTLASPRAASVAAAASSKEVSKGSASPNKGGQGTGASKEGGFRLQHGKGSENYGSTGEVAVRESCSKLEGVVDVVPEAIAKAFALAAVCETPTPADDGGVEASFGDNALDLETGDNRRTRETTPCSLIRDSENIPTPGSTSRPSRRKLHNAACRNIPTTLEMEEFFADAEQVLQQEQRAFMEKYNFDPVNDCPLPGRYEWVRVESL